MGLFSKKPPCPICGGKISWFLPSKIEGECICDTIGFDVEEIQVVHTTMISTVDAIEEIKKYKVLMEEGILTQREFEAKKKQPSGGDYNQRRVVTERSN